MPPSILSVLPIASTPSTPESANPLRQLADQAKRVFQDTFQQQARSLGNKSGQILVVVEQAQIICSQTLPGQKLNALMVAEPRSLVEGRRLANIQDVQTQRNIKPWPCKCKRRPSGNDYLPCDYKPAGLWNPGVKTETSDAAHSPSPQPQSQAGQLGQQHGNSMAEQGLRNISRSPATQEALANAANQTSLSLQDATTVSIMESTGNAAVGTNYAGYTGLMQMGPAAAKDVGMSFQSLLGAANVHNNALAGARYMELSSSWLHSSVPRNTLTMYLSHQQGAGGTNRLFQTLSTNPSAPATPNQLSNLPGQLKQTLGNVTQQDFYDYWNHKVRAVEDKVKAANGAGAGQRLGIPMSATLQCTYGGTLSIQDPGQRSKYANPGGFTGMR